MKNIQIITDSSADLSKEIVEKYGIDVVPFYVSFSEETYLKEGEEISQKDFYDQLVSSEANPKTACPSIDDYYTRFEKAVKENLSVICFTLSQKFSGSFQSAVNAKNMILEDYANAKVEVIDSLSATGGQGLLVLECCKMAENNLDFEEVCQRSKILATTSGILFTVDDLKFLQRGGRIGKASALAGKLLNIKPLIKLDDGELLPEGKVRGRKKAILEIEHGISKKIKNVKEFSFAKLSFFENESPDDLRLDENANYIKLNIGATIGAHTGPTAIGIAYIRNYNDDFVDKLVVKEEKQAIKENKKIGCIGFEPLLITISNKNKEYFYNKYVQELNLKKLKTYKFYGGTIFAIKAELLKCLQHKYYDTDFINNQNTKFPAICYAIEDLLGYIVEAQDHIFYDLHPIQGFIIKLFSHKSIAPYIIPIINKFFFKK